MKARQTPGVVFQPQVHHALQRGIHTLVSAIRPTLGPISGGVAIDHINKSITLPEFIDDGGVIARRIIELPDRDDDIGAMLLRSAITRQSERVGDGIATMAVLFEAIFNGGLRYIAAGGNAMQLRRQLEGALPLVLDALDRMVVQIEGQDALAKLAESLCGEADMARLLGEAFDLVGPYGRLEIREDYGRVLRREYVEGTYYPTGLFSQALMPEPGGAMVMLQNAAVFLCDFEIEDHHTLFPVLQTAHAAGIKALLIVTRSLSDQGVSLLVTNNKLDRIQAVAVKLPGLNPTDRMAALEDLSRLTGAKPFIKEAGETLERVTARDFGTARRLWANTRAFGLVGGGGDPARLREHLRRLKALLHSTEDTEIRKRAQERIAVLLGSSVTLWVGGFTRTEINARKTLAERAARAMRAAMLEGVVPGGGVALLNCRAALEQRRRQSDNDDERMACRLLIEALAAPARALFRNSGYDASEIMARMQQAGPDAGFDVVADQLVNVCEAGIMDSALILKTSLRNAVSTAALALTIDSIVHLSQPEMIGNPE